MVPRQFVQHRFALARQADRDLPPVGAYPAAPHQPAPSQTVDQFDDAVMPKLQALREIAHGRLAAMSFHGQQQLMLRRFEAGETRRLFAEVQEAADLVAKLGQRLVVGRSQLVRVDAPPRNIVPRYTCLDGDGALWAPLDAAVDLVAVLDTLTGGRQVGIGFAAGLLFARLGHVLEELDLC